MLDSLRALLADSVPEVPPMDAPAVPGDIRIAACALLLEMAYADGRMTADERKVVVRSLTRHFGVDERGAEELMQLAESELAETTEATSYTQQLVAEYDQDQRIMLAEMLREVASADGWLDQHEEALMGRCEMWLQVDPGSLGRRAGGK
ncbi:MAG TPA: TerB family tellurite resistance protein, partial [Gemmatimonas sp.]|nr:TerB family tellurite resistance protein [Gemmatimonas sp.]